MRYYRAMRILAIETSCDETAVCLMEVLGDTVSPTFTVLGNALLSQAEKHAAFGGVFPNLAKREHQQNLVPLLSEALRQAGELHEHPSGSHPAAPDFDQLLSREPELKTFMEEFVRTYDAPTIDCIAVTHGPGLEPALWVGINFAKALAHAWQKPIVAVNHMEGHVLAALAREVRGAGDVGRVDSESHPHTFHLAPCTFPAVALLVSGGHTELQLVKSLGTYELLGRTRDDAAGECFDKCARLMGLPYPGGPEISKLAAQARAHKLPPTFALPRPMIDSGDLDFSFSGLKTAVRRLLETHPELVKPDFTSSGLGKPGFPTADEPRALAREVEDAIVDVLVKKTLRAAEDRDAHAIIVGGGVSANAHLRDRLSEAAARAGGKSDLPVLFPPKELSTDNAVMIGMAAFAHAVAGEFADPEHLKATGNLQLSS